MFDYSLKTKKSFEDPLSILLLIEHEERIEEDQDRVDVHQDPIEIGPNYFPRNVGKF